jgi:hypothetical protein
VLSEYDPKNEKNLKKNLTFLVVLAASEERVKSLLFNSFLSRGKVLGLGLELGYDSTI